MQLKIKNIQCVQCAPEAVQSKPTQKTSHLAFLDGIRGIAALYVVLFHALLEVDYRWRGGGLPHSTMRFAQLLEYGHSAVGVFIVLSGYCLMLPVAQDRAQRLKSMPRYFIRRARRILPPYYAALALSLLIVLICRLWQNVPDTFNDYALPALTWSAVLSHLLLIHDLSPATLYKINPPMWSVALEWQIYFLFPFLLLPIWRRFGSVAVVIAALALSVAPHYLLPAKWNLEWTAPWYLCLFAMGMAGAAFTSSQKYNFPWGTCAALFFLVPQVLNVAHVPLTSDAALAAIISDLLTGLAATCLIMYCARAALDGTPGESPMLLRILESPAAITLGSFSYSLYLVHNPIQGLTNLALHTLHWSPTVHLLCLLFVETPLIVLLAYGFHLLFERRFMSQSLGRETANLHFVSPPNKDAVTEISND